MSHSSTSAAAAATPLLVAPPPSAAPVKPREIFGWCCFDFANSAFTTIIITVVYARFFANVVAGKDPQAMGWWGTMLSFSQIIVITLSPLLGVIADLTARKKIFLMSTALVCSVATGLLYFFGAGAIWPALALVCVANIAFSMSENLCASFLPEISTPENAGKISGYGWSFGYCGGLISLLLALAIIESGEGRAPWTFVMTAGFFLLASAPTLLLLRERAVPRRLPTGQTYLSLAFAQLKNMRRDLPQHRRLAIFFVAMTLYISGLSAVIGFSSMYAGEVMGMSDSETIKLFIVLQLAGVAGAFGFGFLQDRVGPKLPLVLALFLWIAACGWAAVCRSVAGFYGVGILAGIAMGSLQSASRAVVSSLTPEGRGGEFFGYWGFFGKLAGVIGPFVFGWLATLLGLRTAIAVNALFFVAGLLVLLPLKLHVAKPSAAEAQRA